MYIDLLFLLIMYVFSALGVLLALYALWVALEVKEDLRRSRIQKRLNSVASQTRAKPRSAWPPK